MLYIEAPDDFNSKFEAAGCFIEHNGKILLLLRQDAETYGNIWGLPSGSIDEGETPLQAVKREIREETGMSVSGIKFFSKVFVHYPEYDFIYYVYHANLHNKSRVILNPREHKDFKWISPKDALTMPLIQDLDACIHLFLDIKKGKKSRT